ncbi:ABC transporter substrate-binding protein [Cohnella fermenti]|nr:ABC transporter substrate-binding protein [Cohnella fermenti]
MAGKRKVFAVGAMILLLLGTIMTACGSSASVEESKDARTVVDARGKNVVLPARMERIVFIGNSIDDLFVLGIAPVGANLQNMTKGVYDERMESIVDVGHPGDAERILALNPDLIIASINVMDAQGMESLEAIAPTVAYEHGKSLYDRLRFFGEVLDKREEVETWIAGYEAKVEQAWSELASTVPAGSTASVFIYEGKTFYIMGNRGLPLTLFNERHGFAPAGKTADLIRDGEPFVDISSELLPEYAGDYIFFINSADDEDNQFVDEFLRSSFAQSLPAVRNGKVFHVDSKWNHDGAIVREQLLNELKTILQPNSAS